MIKPEMLKKGSAAAMNAAGMKWKTVPSGCP